MSRYLTPAEQTHLGMMNQLILMTLNLTPVVHWDSLPQQHQDRHIDAALKAIVGGERKPSRPTTDKDAKDFCTNYDKRMANWSELEVIRDMAVCEQERIVREAIDRDVQEQKFSPVAAIPTNERTEA